MDLLCRMVVVVGCPSGGTSAVTGTLTKNGYYNRGHKSPYFETGCAGKNMRAQMWGFPTRKAMVHDLHGVKKYFHAYTKEAVEAGFERAVVKMAWGPLWEPEIFDGTGVDVLLVHRDIESHAASIQRRNMHKSPYWMAKIGQERILQLHAETGWPMFTFGKAASHEDLEATIGHPLPVRYFEPSAVRH